MKKLILTIMMCAALFVTESKAQNSIENFWFKVQYNGKISNGYNFTLTNKYSCPYVMGVKIEGVVTSTLPVLPMNLGTTSGFTVIGTVTAIKFAANSVCIPGGISDTLTFLIPTTLPLLFGEIKVKPYHNWRDGRVFLNNSDTTFHINYNKYWNGPQYIEFPIIESGHIRYW